jgi:hypothetical protein
VAREEERRQQLLNKIDLNLFVRNRRAKMTTDSKISVCTANSIIRIKKVPQGIVSSEAEENRCGYDGRLFFCQNYQFLEEKRDRGLPTLITTGTLKNKGRTCSLGAEIVEKLCKRLALQPLIYYSDKVFNVIGVVGLWLMQGVAKLRNVAEVEGRHLLYLRVPHIANSKGTILAQ